MKIEKLTTVFLTEFCKFKCHKDFVGRTITKYNITETGSVVFIYWNETIDGHKHEGYLYADIVEIMSFMWMEIHNKIDYSTTK
jgi:hypothetical protein